MKALIYVDGSERAQQAVRFATPILAGLKASVTLLGLVNGRQRALSIHAPLKKAVELLGGAAQDLQIRLRRGDRGQRIVEEVSGGDYQLVVFPSRGRHHLGKLLLGSTAAYVISHVQTTVLVVKGRSERISRILVCTAGGGHGLKDVERAAQIAQAVAAQVTVLHVMSQLPLTEERFAEQLVMPENLFLASAAREASHLRQAMALLEQTGVGGRPKVRHGLVLDEVVAELAEGGYDLLVIGAHSVAGPWKQVLGDEAEQILLSVNLPVLVVHD